jgi:hypothetical protein
MKVSPEITTIHNFTSQSPTRIIITT